MNNSEKENMTAFSDTDPLKIGRVTPGEHLSEIQHYTEDGKQVRVSGIYQDPEDPDSIQATMYTYDPATGDAEVHHGHIRGSVREAGNYIWEHKKGTAATLGGVVVSVVMGSLWVRHRKK